MSANSNTQNSMQKAYFALSESVIAQGFFDPDVYCNGFRVPLFSLDECEKIIKILESQDKVEYLFKRNKDDSGYILTDTDETSTKTTEQADSTVIFNGETIKVNGLADGWCWEDISEDSYREWNISIKKGEVYSTVEHLQKL